MGPERREPEWFDVVGGPPPKEVVLADMVRVLLPPMVLICLSLFLPPLPRLLLLVAAVLAALGLSVAVRRRWQRRQGVRVHGNVLEHRDGERVVRVALTRAVVSSAVAAPGMLVLVLDDGRARLAVGRRAEPHEISGLPPRHGPYLELMPDDFEEVRIAAQRSYPQA